MIACSTIASGSVQRALLVPTGGDTGEVLLSGGSTAAADDRQPIEVGRQHSDRRSSISASTSLTSSTDRTVGDEIEERPRAFAVLVDHAGISEQLEVAGDARLRLAEDVGEISDGQLAVLQQRHDPQAGLLVDRPQDIDYDRRTECHRRTI